MLYGFYMEHVKSFLCRFSTPSLFSRLLYLWELHSLSLAFHGFWLLFICLWCRTYWAIECCFLIPCTLILGLLLSFYLPIFQKNWTGNWTSSMWSLLWNSSSWIGVWRFRVIALELHWNGAETNLIVESVDEWSCWVCYETTVSSLSQFWSYCRMSVAELHRNCTGSELVSRFNIEFSIACSGTALKPLET